MGVQPFVKIETRLELSGMFWQKVVARQYVACMVLRMIITNIPVINRLGRFLNTLRAAAVVIFQCGKRVGMHDGKAHGYQQ